MTRAGKALAVCVIAVGGLAASAAPALAENQGSSIGVTENQGSSIGAAENQGSAPGTNENQGSSGPRD